MVGILHYMKLSGRVSPACRGSNDAISPIWWCDHRLTQRLVTLMSCNFPRLVVARPQREVVCSPKCRPIGSQQPKIGRFGWVGLYFGGFGVTLGVLLAHEPLNMRVNPLIRT